MLDQVSGKISKSLDWFVSLSSEEEGDEEESVAETKQALEEEAEEKEEEAEEKEEEEQLNQTLAEMKAQEVAELKR